MASILLFPVRLIENAVYHLAPDYTPLLDDVINTFEILTGPGFLYIADFAIRIAIYLLVATPRQIQLSPSEYETNNLLDTYDYIVGKRLE